MQRAVLTATALICLAGCDRGAPAAPTLSDVPLAAEAGRAAALPDPAESQPEGGFLAGTATADAPVTQDGAAAGSAASDRLAPPARGGLLGFFRRKAAAAGPAPDAPDYAQVGPGATLPFGEVARLCGVAETALGTEVARYPETGRGYTLRDSAPDSTTPRSFWITGFDDGCARQVTGALAMFGDPELHERLRYGPAGSTLPEGPLDRAYEAVKTQVCRVAGDAPCGRALPRLARDTVFVSVYPALGSPRSADMLLHDGALLEFAAP
ncbi:MAG: hypothetical protein ACU0A5_10085 [Salipiger marinus]|uniref:hypothetical protein n=1 Tax=Salipiger marinus TaxID=555512 RepID=UPI0040597DF9